MVDLHTERGVYGLSEVLATLVGNVWGEGFARCRAHVDLEVYEDPT